MSSVFDGKAAGKAVRKAEQALDALAAIYQAANSSPAFESQATANALAKAREALEALKTINVLTAI
jgi:flavin-binding protein dodecin